MGLAVAFHLGDLDHRLPARALLGIGDIERCTIHPGGAEHQPVGEIGIVWRGQHLPAGEFLVPGEIVPQVFRVDCLGRGQGQDLVGEAGIVAEDHHAVQVCPARRGRPFKPDQGGEPARLVIGIGDLADMVPDTALEGFVVEGRGCAPLERDRWRQKLGVQGGIVLIGLRPEILRAPALAPVSRQQGLVAFLDRLPQAEEFGVVGHDEEIERARQAQRGAEIVLDNLAACELVGGFHAEIEAAAIARIERGQVGVQVRVAPEDLARAAHIDIGRVGFLSGGWRRGDSQPGQQDQGACAHQANRSHRYSPLT